MPSTLTQSNGLTGELAGLVASIGTMALGAALMLDDVEDFGLDGSERDPPVPHHYIYGVLMLLGGVAGMCYSGLSLLKKINIGQ